MNSPYLAVHCFPNCAGAVRALLSQIPVSSSIQVHVYEHPGASRICIVSNLAGVTTEDQAHLEGTITRLLALQQLPSLPPEALAQIRQLDI